MVEGYRVEEAVGVVHVDLLVRADLVVQAVRAVVAEGVARAVRVEGVVVAWEVGEQLGR